MALATLEVTNLEWFFVAASETAWPIASAIARPLALVFLGALKERNGATLEEIVEAAAKAQPLVCGGPACPRHGYLHPDEKCAPAPFDRLAFFHAIALEARGQGRVFDTFAEFALLPRSSGVECAGCDHCEHVGRCRHEYRNMIFGDPGEDPRCRCEQESRPRPFTVPSLIAAKEIVR